MEPICLHPGTVVGVWEQTGAGWVLGDLFTIATPPRIYYTVPEPPPHMTFLADHPQTLEERRQLRRRLGNRGEPKGEVLPDNLRQRPKPAPANQKWVKVGLVLPWYHGKKSRMEKTPAERTHSEGHHATTNNKESDNYYGNP